MKWMNSSLTVYRRIHPAALLLFYLSCWTAFPLVLRKIVPTQRKYSLQRLGTEMTLTSQGHVLILLMGLSMLPARRVLWSGLYVMPINVGGSNQVGGSKNN